MQHDGRQAPAQAAADRFLSGLSIALDHPLLSIDPLVLCSAARACKSWRQAVQQCRACNTAVVIGPGYASHLGQAGALVKLSSFAQWLPKHAALVRSITADTSSVRRVEVIYGLPNQLPVTSIVEIAQQLLQPAMQLAAAGEPAPPPLPGTAAAAAAAANLALQPQQRRGLRLVSFKSDWPGMPSMLNALPAHSLTLLKLELWPSTVLTGHGLATALARLSNLQELSLSKTHGSDCSIPISCLVGVAQLSQLTSLSLAGRWSGSGQQLQQFLALPLPLRWLQMDLNMRLPKLDLTHCSQLQHLSIKTPCNLPLGSALPLQLQHFQLLSNLGAGDQLAELQLQQLLQLRYVGLQIPMTAGSLQGLTQLQALQHVALGYCAAGDAEQTATTWQLLPQLKELTVMFTNDTPDRVQMSVILRGIQSCSSLTKLKLEVRVIEVEEEEDPEDDEPAVVQHRVQACSYLTGLTNLQDLHFVKSSLLTTADALQLTVLTGLTRLVLGGLGKGVGELAANAIACCLKQLRHLDLQDCELGSMSCLATVAHLWQLTELKLEGNDGLTRQGLMMLTRLSNLQKLGVDKDDMTIFALQRFWAAVRGQ